MKHSIALDISFDLRRKIMASRKPFEDFDGAVERLVMAALSGVEPATNARRFQRSPKRWPLCVTDKQWYNHDLKRFIEHARADGYTDSEEDLAEMFDDVEAFDADVLDPDDWRSASDVSYKHLEKVVLAAIQGMKQGDIVHIARIVERECPKLRKLNGSYNVMSKLKAALYRNPQFVLAVVETVEEEEIATVLRKA